MFPRLFGLFALTTLCFSAQRIMVNRIGPSEATLYVANADGSDARPLLNASGFDYNGSYSPDGKWIVFTSERDGSADIYRVHPDGTGVERLTQEPSYEDQAALSPDGTKLAFVSTRAAGYPDIWVLDLKTKKARNLTPAGNVSTSENNTFHGNFRPSWSPDGKWIAFSSDRDTPFRRHPAGWEHVQAASIYIIQPDGTGLRRITNGEKSAGSPKWSADGKRIVFYELPVEQTFNARTGRQADSQIISVDVASGERMTHVSGPGLRVEPQFLPGGRVGFLMKTGDNAGLAFSDGAKGGGGALRAPAWSPDGKHVVFQRFGYAPRQVNSRLSGGANPEFDLRYSDVFPAFSKTGKLAVTDFRASLNDGAASISTMDADGSGIRRVFLDKDGAAMVPSWSPDGSWIAFGFGSFFNTRGQRPARVRLVKSDGSETKDLPTGPLNAGFPSYSPDGKRIVYRVWNEKEQGLRIINLEDNSVTNLTNAFDNFPSWSPTGEVIVFTRTMNPGNFDLFSIHPDGSGLKRLTTAEGNDAHSAWSPDGKFIIWSSSRYGFKDESPLYDRAPQPFGELFIMNADGSNQRPLTDNNWEEASPAWVPSVAMP